jgi:hypothetical protein
MFKFFKRVRQQLLSENRISKYLLYATGEIVLVVIGILIALQVNNWNEGRKLEMRNTENLASLSQELVANQKELTVHIERVRNQIRTGLNMIDTLNNGSITVTRRDTYLLERLGELGPLRLRPLTTTTLDEIINTGSYSGIHSTEIKNNLLTYQAQLSNMKTTMERFEDFWQNIEQPYLITHFSITDMLTNRDEKWNIQDRQLLGEKIPDFKRVNFYFKSNGEAFFNNREYTSMMTSRYFDLRAVLKSMNWLNESIDKLLESIDSVR